MKRNIRWIEPEETIDSGESTVVDDYFAHEEFYENEIVDTSYLGSERLRSLVEYLFGDEKLF